MERLKTNFSHDKKPQESLAVPLRLLGPVSRAGRFHFLYFYDLYMVPYSRAFDKALPLSLRLAAVAEAYGLFPCSSV